MIRFVHPEAFLLAPAVLLVLRGRIRAPGRTATALRILLLSCACALLADPYVAGRAEGRDLILVVDRSRSMPADADATFREWADLARRHRRRGDRVGLVVFGREAAVEEPPREEWSVGAGGRRVDPDGTDLAAALRAGLSLVPPGRHGSLLVLSDGEETGSDPGAAAREALRRGVRVDAVHVRREGVMDLAVDEVATPGEVGRGEPFQFSAWVRTDRAIEAPVRLLRDGAVIAEAKRTLRKGLNRLVFRDCLVRPGIHHYAVEVPLAQDNLQQNNRAQAVVRVVGPARVLCVTPRGRADRLTRSLANAGVAVDVAAPGAAPLHLDGLDGVRAVVLENVPVADLPGGALAALRAYVRDLGGGLLMTGGRASFGPGGYHRSALEEVLPVSLEIRQEQRRFGIAMAIALDRSGSMSMVVPTGEKKMDLANLGTVAAVELLGALDAVSVIAVDSMAHVVVPMRQASDRQAIVDKVRTIEAGGGGIFVNNALKEAARELAKAAQDSKHLVLFADARDAEQPGDYRDFVPKLVQAGVTVSVIGLGTERDVDATFLKDVARLGNGRAFFVQDPKDLPRVFAQETIQVARSSVVEQPTPLAVVPDIVALGEMLKTGLPETGGYSIAYLKAGATLGAVTQDEQKAPFLAFWQHGLGRAATVLGEADGDMTGAWAAWDGYADFYATVARWVAGTEASDQVFASLRREGHDAVLSVEVEAGNEALLEELRPRVLGPGETPVPVYFHRTGERTLEARIPLSGHGVYRAAVQFGQEGVFRVAPITLPYSPEFEPRSDLRSGERTLQRITRIAEGRLDPTATQIWDGPRTGRGIQRLGRAFAIALLLLLLAEIAVRRFGLRVPKVRVKVPAAVARLVPRKKPAPEPERVPERRPEETKRAPDPEPEEGIGSLLDRAKDRARRRQ